MADHQNQMPAKRKHRIPSCSKAERAEPFSFVRFLSAPNSLTSAKRLLSDDNKKKVAAKRKPKHNKSKAKQVVVSDNSRKLGKKKRVKIDDLYDNLEAKFNVMERAGWLLANLATELPTFVKCMLPSNVAYGFWLILPTKFCNVHLPKEDARVVLVDEFGNEYNTKYLQDRHGLSAGWRRFSLAHRLHKGDILVFHLIGPCKLNVHIVRVYGLEEFDAALCLMNFETPSKRIDSGKGKRTYAKDKTSDTPIPEAQIRLKNGKMASNSCHGLVTDDSEGSEISSQTQIQIQELFSNSTFTQGQCSLGDDCAL